MEKFEKRRKHPVVRPTTISGINLLPDAQKRGIYGRVIPPELLDYFSINNTFQDDEGHDLLIIHSPDGSADVEIELYHQYGFEDPVLYGHMTDTINGKFHILLYVINDPHSPRFDIDRLPDGSPTELGTLNRHYAAEIEALQAGLAPGQVRRGLRLLSSAIHTFEQFVISLGHDIHFADPLSYHNALIFERYGYAYEKGRKLMERIHSGFSPGGDLRRRLEGSSPFRMPEAANSIRLRSWAIHDGIIGEPFTGVTMYKLAGKTAGISTCTDCDW